MLSLVKRPVFEKKYINICVAWCYNGATCLHLRSAFTWIQYCCLVAFIETRHNECWESPKKIHKAFSLLSNCSYFERRRNLNLMTLELRRLYADLVVCYKIVFNIVKLKIRDFFTFKLLLLVVIRINCMWVVLVQMLEGIFCTPCG